MATVDIKQSITADNEGTADIKVEYHTQTENVGTVYYCILTLTNGFRAIGRVEKTYMTNMADSEGYGIAHQRALKYIEMHGYSLV
jgi:hypothetical protein